jgi:DNA-binding NarL/FixJ family response regulator
MTRVVVLAESALARAGLEALLGDDPAVQVVHAAPLAAGPGGGSRPSPWELTAELAADVVLWAPDPAPGLAGRLVADLDDAPAGSFGDVPAAALPALVVVADVAPGDAAAVLRAGARAVLPTTADAAAVGAAVGAAAAGLVVLPAADAAALLALAAADGGARPASAARGGRPAAAGAGPLSAREREVLALMAEGLANKQIAPRLGISEHTVKAHVAAVFAKLGAGTRAEAVVTAARRGLLML